jgi:type I restriction enzyme S subunit
MNKTLEAVGEAVFKRWFVDFEFPNQEGKPYKSSGGQMVESERGEIPKGWSTKKLREFGKIVCGKTPPKSNKDFFGGCVPFIKIPDMHNQPFIIETEDSLTHEGELFQANKTVPSGSICISCIATVGLVSLTSRESQTNQQINCIIPYEESHRYYLFFVMKSLKKELEDLGSGGSATLNVNTNTFSDIQIIEPEQELVKAYHRITEPLLLKLRTNLFENRTLSQIRDSLLPKLMSGKIRVPITKEEMEPAIHA